MSQTILTQGSEANQSNSNQNGLPRTYVNQTVLSSETSNSQKLSKAAEAGEHSHSKKRLKSKNDIRSEKNKKLKIRNVQEINQNLEVFSNHSSFETTKPVMQRGGCSNENTNQPPPTNRLPQHNLNQQSNMVNPNPQGAEFNHGEVLNSNPNSRLNASGGVLNESRIQHLQNIPTTSGLPPQPVTSHAKPTNFTKTLANTMTSLNSSLPKKQPQSRSKKDCNRLATATGSILSATQLRTKPHQVLDVEKHNQERLVPQSEPNKSLSEQKQHLKPNHPVASTSQLPASSTIATTSKSVVVKRIERSGAESAKRLPHQNVVNSQPIDVDQMDMLKELNTHQDISIFAISKKPTYDTSASGNDNNGDKSSDKGK